MSEMNLTAMNLASHPSSGVFKAPKPTLLDMLLSPVRTWIDSMEIQDRETAYLVCKLIPGECPFERDVFLFGRKLAHIPPMCKINPLYEQFVGLRFRSLCYLVDVCGESMPS
jgi:Mo-dependent nitrogenase C-terminus